MKINEIIVYHGSQIERPRFQKSHTGQNSHTFGPYQSTRWGIFFSDNPDFARMYGRIREYRLNVSKTADLDLFGGEIVSQFAQTLDAHDPAQRDIWIAATYNRKIWQMFEDEVGASFTKFLRRQGYDSAKFTETNEDDQGNEHTSRSTVVFSSRSVRVVPTRSVPEKLREVTGSQAVVMYHMTPTINLRRIMTQGLIPKIGRRSRTLGEKVPAIYLFHDIDSAENALENWYGEEFGETTRIALLQVVVPLDATETEGAGYERVLTSPIPPANIRVLHKDVGALYQGDMQRLIDPQSSG